MPSCPDTTRPSSDQIPLPLPLSPVAAVIEAAWDCADLKHAEALAEHGLSRAQGGNGHDPLNLQLG